MYNYNLINLTYVHINDKITNEVNFNIKRKIIKYCMCFIKKMNIFLLLLIIKTQRESCYL